MKTTPHRALVKITCMLLIVPSSASLADSYPPDNAAVLYYKAFLMFREPSAEVKGMMRDLREGKIKPNDQIKQHLEENKSVLEFAETAASIDECNWGHDLSRGMSVLMPELLKVRLTAFMLCAKAQILAEDGQYKAALTQCLTVHRMARHVSDSLLISYLVGTSLNDLANERIQDVLSTMPQDLDTLTWLRGELAAFSVNAPSIHKAMATEKKFGMQELRREKMAGIPESMGDHFVKDKMTAEVARKVKAGDVTFFRDSRAYYAKAMDDTLLAFDLPYAQSHRRLEDIDERVQKDAKTEEKAVMTALLSPAVSRVRTVGTKSGTFFNAIRAAIEISMIKARTGKLPATLPADLPKDLFSGKDFEYTQSKGGFVLRCQAKDLDKDTLYEYEFGISK